MDLNLSFEEGVKTADMPLVKLIVNDHEGYFLVDTGANVCFIDETFAKEIGAEEIPPIINNATSLMGNSSVSHSYNVAFNLNAVLLTDIPCAGTDTRAINESLRECGLAYPQMQMKPPNHCGLCRDYDNPARDHRDIAPVKHT